MNTILKKLINGGSGYRISLSVMLGWIGSCLYFGRDFKNELYRCGWAGITSTLIVEFSTHAISTLDVNSKTTKNFSLSKYFKNNSLRSLMNGFQPMIYGLTASVFLYYYLYKGIKEEIKAFFRKYDIDDRSLKAIAIMSAGSSAIWELVAICFYYPFDLIKARMQRDSHYNYKNTTDGLYQIYNKSRKTSLFSELYRGAGVFSLSYGMYTVFEFMLYETILAGITNYSKTKSFGHQKDSDDEIHIENHSKKRNIWHVLISSFIAGGLAATIWNPLEYWLAIAQNSKGKSIREIILSTPNIRSWWKGAHFSIMYYALNAWFLFLTLEKTWEILDWSLTEAE